ncbi:MAG: glycoside hydrolase family 2 protein [Acidobacteriota bacterium]
MQAALAAVLFAAAPALLAENAALIRSSLDGEWQFRQAGQTRWIPARVPGCVHLDLMAAGIIPDPFYRDNEVRVQWVENEDWEYRKEFKLPAAIAGKPHIDLVAQGLDTFATITLNGQKVGETDNMFRAYRFDIKPYIKSGQNELLIRFDSPVRRAKAKEEKLPYKLPGGSPHVRKAPYHFGWDWGPRLVTSGVWRPLAIEAWEGARLGEFEITQDFLERNKVLLKTRVQIISDRSHKLAVKATISGKEAFTHSEVVPINPGLTTNEKSFGITNPDLWWPAGMGRQNLTTVKIELYHKGRLLDSLEKRIGFRTLVLEQKEDEWGKSFRFVVNGVPFFAKGGNWIPADSFPPRVTRQKYESLLRDCVTANMNMLRVWGGGIYESPDFYDLCDELGLVVWQDFMFACAMFPGDEIFLENVRAEAEQVVKELRHHPSIALWCGNNECEEGWFHWGWKQQYSASVWADYEKIFHQILPQAVEKLDPARAYWPSSPHSEKVGEPRSDRSGDTHYWGVWHGKEPFTEYRKKFHRFFSEFGFQSFPLIETIRTFTLSQDWNIASPVMEQHQKHPEGNRLILLYLLDHYRLPKDFASLLWVSEVLQAEGMKTAVEHFRSQMPRVMGALYWQINDCWPVASWSGTDYYGTWKALHYYARRFYSPVLVVPVEEDKTLKIYGVSDLDQAVDVELSLGVFNYDGTVVEQGKTPIRLDPRSSRLVASKPLEELRAGLPPESIYLYCELKKGEETLSSNVFHFTPLKRVELPEPEIAAEVFEKDGQAIVRLRALRFAKNVYVSAAGVEGRFGDNFFDLVPGVSRLVRLISDGAVSADELRQSLKIISLRDTY